jgi:hypothetical protein
MILGLSRLAVACGRIGGGAKMNVGESMHHLTLSALCLALLAAPSTAQKPKAVDGESSSSKSGGANAATSKAEPRNGSWPHGTFSQWEYWTNVTISPGSSVNLDAQFDYSTTDTVRVTVRSAGSDLSNFVMSSYWAVPHLSSYGVADVVVGTSFPYMNAGGATFNTYGSQFRLQVTNNSANPITLTQVLVFARVH